MAKSGHGRRRRVWKARENVGTVPLAGAAPLAATGHRPDRWAAEVRTSPFPPLITHAARPGHRAASEGSRVGLRRVQQGLRLAWGASKDSRRGARASSGMENAQQSDRQRCEGGAVQVRGDHVCTSSDLRRVRARKGKVSGRRRTQREGRGRAAETSSEAGDAGSRCWQLRRGSPRPVLWAGGALPGKAGVRQNAPEGEQGSRQGGRLGCF